MDTKATMNAKMAVGFLITTLIIDMLAFTSILPLFPSILTFYSKDQHRDFLYNGCVSLLKQFQYLVGVPHNERYNNVFFGGLLGSVFSALQFISSPSLGSLSDVYGRRTMLLISCMGTMISYIIWLWADTFTVFVLSRILGGLSKANINIATAIISDIYSPQDYPKGMALIGISYSIGFLIGPMIGAYFSTVAPHNSLHSVPAIFCIILTIIQFAIILFILPETLSNDERKKLDDVKTKAKQLIFLNELFKFSAVDTSAEKKREMQHIGSIYFIYIFLYAGLEFTLPFLTHIRFDFGSMQQGKIYLFTGFMMLLIQGFFVRKTPMHKQKRLAEFGIMCIIPAYLVISQAYSLPVLYFGLVLYAIASATVVTSLTSLISAVHPQLDKGVLAGVFRSIGALGRSLGPICASTLFWLAGPTRCYTAGSLLLLIPLLLLRRVRNPDIVIKVD